MVRDRTPHHNLVAIWNLEQWNQGIEAASVRAIRRFPANSGPSLNPFDFPHSGRSPRKLLA
jgi:hypothetical protein